MAAAVTVTSTQRYTQQGGMNGLRPLMPGDTFRHPKRIADFRGNCDGDNDTTKKPVSQPAGKSPAAEPGLVLSFPNRPSNRMQTGPLRDKLVASNRRPLRPPGTWAGG